MRRIFLYHVLFFICFSQSCCQSLDVEEVLIKPLHPYSASPYFYNRNEKKKQSYVNKYFFISGACKPTITLSNYVDSFVIDFVKSDSDYLEFGGYNLYFYKQTKEINGNFRTVIDGMISHNSLDDYQAALMYHYSWSDKAFTGCRFYKNGRILKTVYEKGKDFLRGSKYLPVTDSTKIVITNLPDT